MYYEDIDTHTSEEDDEDRGRDSDETVDTGEYPIDVDY